MGVDVVDLGGVDARPRQRLPHGPDRTQPLWMWRREVVHVGAGAVAGHLGEDLRAAGLRELHLLEHEHHAALAHDEAVAVEVERPAGLLGLVVALAHRLDLAEGPHGQRGDGGLRAAGQHRPGVTALDDLGGLPDAVPGRRAGADDGVVGPSRPRVDGDQARRHVGDHHRHRERGDAPDAALQQHRVALLDLLHAPDARGDDDAHVVWVEFGGIEVGVLQRQPGGRQGELAETAGVTGRLPVHVPLGVEVPDLGGDLGRVVGGVEAGDPADAGDALDQVGPDGLQVVPYRGHEAETGDRHAAAVGVAHLRQHYGRRVEITSLACGKKLAHVWTPCPEGEASLAPTGACADRGPGGGAGGSPGRPGRRRPGHGASRSGRGPYAGAAPVPLRHS